MEKVDRLKGVCFQAVKADFGVVATIIKEKALLRKYPSFLLMKEIKYVCIGTENQTG